jgi:hypothetical protein
MMLRFQRLLSLTVSSLVLAGFCANSSSAKTLSFEKVEAENARVYLNSLPELQKKIIQSKFEKITYHDFQMVELFTPENSDEAGDPIVVLVQGDPGADEKAFPELAVPLHRLMNSHLGVYFFKGRNKYGSVSDATNLEGFRIALNRVAAQFPERGLIIIGYAKGRDLIRSSPELLKDRANVRFVLADSPDLTGLATTVERVAPLDKQRPDRRAVYRCCISKCEGGPKGPNSELEIGYFRDPIKTFEGIEYRGFVHAFGAVVPGRLGYDNALLSKVDPWRVDPNYVYLTVARNSLAKSLANRARLGSAGDHAIVLNTATPSEAWIWLNYYEEYKAGGGKVSAPLPLSCAIVTGEFR